MALLIGPMRKHLNGYKELTNHKEVIACKEPEKVYISLFMGNAKIECLVKEGDYVKVGTKIAERNDHFYVPIFASVSGKVAGIEKRMTSALKMADHIVIENDYKYETEQLPTLSEDASKEEIVEFIKSKGIVGCGGAGFPTYVKFNNVTTCETFIINAVECEPYITADYLSMHDNMELFKLGVKTLFKASGAKVCKIGIKVTKKDFIEVLKNEFKDIAGVEIVAVPDVYPMGWERTLIYELTKKRYDRLPIEAGCIVSNATTAIKFAEAMKTGSPIVKKIVTVSGDAIKEPCNVECYVGTPASLLVETCGGYTCDDVQIIAGGPMMGTSCTTDAFVIAPQSNALTIKKYVEVKSMSCLRCGKCVDHCPSGLQPCNINQAENTKNVERLERLNVMGCIECGMCTYICPSKLDVTEGVRRAKRYMALRAKK